MKEESTTPQDFKTMAKRVLPSSMQRALETEEPLLPWSREWFLFFLGSLLVIAMGAGLFFYFRPSMQEEASSSSVEVIEPVEEMPSPPPPQVSVGEAKAIDDERIPQR